MIQENGFLPVLHDERDYRGLTIDIEIKKKVQKQKPSCSDSSIMACQLIAAQHLK
jgi:hypothetical protein